MARVCHLSLPIILALAAVILAGCASSGSSRDQIETSEPGTLPSDYDPVNPENNAQPQQASSFDLLSLFTGNDAREQTRTDATETRALRQELARLRADLRTRTGTSLRRAQANHEGAGIALIFPNASDAAATRAYTAMADVAGEYPLTPVSPTRFEQGLTASSCQRAQLAECGRAAAAATGARLAALITGTQPADGRLPLAIKLVDLDLGIRYPAFHIELPADNNSAADESLEALADAVYLHAIERLRLAPEVYHVIGDDADGWALRTPGAAFNPGTRFSVHSGGRVIRQAGEVAAWIPDQSVATLKAVRRTGNGLLVLQRIDGRTPRPTDLVLPQP